MQSFFVLKVNPGPPSDAADATNTPPPHDVQDIFYRLTEETYRDIIQNFRNTHSFREDIPLMRINSRDHLIGIDGKDIRAKTIEQINELLVKKAPGSD